MGNALRMGLAGGLMGAMAGAYDQWQNTQQEIKTERLRAARKLENEALAKIAAENEAAKDAREHGQALEIEGVKSKTRAELEASKEDGRNKRSRDRIAADDRRSAASHAAALERAKIGATRPATASKPSWKPVKQGDGWIYVDQVTNAPVLDEQGQPRQAPPPYRERESSTTPKATPFEKLREDTAKEVSKMPLDQVKKELQSRGVPAPVSPSAADAKRTLIDALVTERNEALGYEIPTAPKPASAPSGMMASGLAKPKNQAEYDKLPKGARFIDPDGAVRIKP